MFCSIFFLGCLAWGIALWAVLHIIEFPCMDNVRRRLGHPRVRPLALLAAVSPAISALTGVHEQFASAIGLNFRWLDAFAYFIGTPIVAAVTGTWLALSREENPHPSESVAIVISLTIWIGNLMLAPFWGRF